MPNHYLRWRVLEVDRRNGRPFHPACGRPCVVCHRPCGGHNKDQGFFGHHSPLVDHRTVGHQPQAFVPHNPSGVETWERDGRRDRGGERKESASGRDDSRDPHGYNDRLCGRLAQSDRRGDRHDGHLVDNCRPRCAVEHCEDHYKHDYEIISYLSVHSDSNSLSTKIAAVKLFYSALSILAGQVFKDTKKLVRLDHNVSHSK